MSQTNDNFNSRNNIVILTLVVLYALLSRNNFIILTLIILCIVLKSITFCINYYLNMKNKFSNFFDKYFENKINQVYDQLKSNPEHLFNFLENIANHNSNYNSFSENLQKKINKFEKSTNCKQTNNSVSIVDNYNYNNDIDENKKDSKNKENMYVSTTDNYNYNKDDNENKNNTKNKENIDDSENNFNIYSNLSTLKNYFNNLEEYNENFYAGKYPFDLMTEKQQKKNLIWTFGQFNKVKNIMPYNFDGEQMIDPADDLYINFQHMDDDFKLLNYQKTNNKIQITKLSQPENSTDMDIPQLIKWKKEVQSKCTEHINNLKNNEFNNNTDVNNNKRKTHHECTEYFNNNEPDNKINTGNNKFEDDENFGMYFFRNFVDDDNEFSSHDINNDYYKLRKIRENDDTNIENDDTKIKNTILQTYVKNQHEDNSVLVHNYLVHNNEDNYEQEQNIQKNEQDNNTDKVNELKKIIKTLELEKNITDEKTIDYFNNQRCNMVTSDFTINDTYEYNKNNEINIENNKKIENITHSTELKVIDCAKYPKYANNNNTYMIPNIIDENKNENKINKKILLKNKSNIKIINDE